jgi:thiamine-phosphate pyrophosphorylase
MLPFSKPCLALVTDRHLCPPSRTIKDQVPLAIGGGVDMVQIREKDLHDNHVLQLIEALRPTTKDKAKLIVNGRPQLVKDSGADGSHIGEQSIDLDSVRELLGNDLLIGRSVHSVAGAVEAEAAGADFLFVGTIYETPSHPGSLVTGTRLLEEVRRAVAIPFLAIGGINRTNIAEVMATGVAGVAVVRALMSATDPEQVASELKEMMLDSLPRIGSDK